MDTLHISDIQWTKEFMMLPGSKRRFSLHHLYIGADSGTAMAESPEEQAKLYVLKHHRTNELICQILVSQHEQDEYNAFENQLLSSRLR